MPKVTWTGDASSAEAAAKKLAAAQESVNKKFADGAKGAKALEQAALAIVKANEGPQEKYNRRLAEATAAYKAGKISVDDLTKATQRYKAELDKAGQSGLKAFGSDAAGSIRRVALEITGITNILSVAVQGFQEFNAEREKAAQNARGARVGLGSLSQLAAGESNPRAAFSRLVSEARGFVGSGAAADENEAGALLFELASAGLGRGDRSFAAQLRSAGTLQNIGGAAAAFDALTTSLGAGEVGNFRQFASKALRAAGPAPGSFEQLPIAAAASGGSARALGISDEFLLAATTILGKQAGSIDEGGTLLSALLRQVEKANRKDFKGLGGIGLIEKLGSLPAAQQGFGGILGDRAEAVSALRVLRENLPQLRSLEADVIGAQATDLAGTAAGLPGTDPQIRAAIAQARATGRRDVQAGDLFSEAENLRQAALADIAVRRRRESPGFLTEGNIFFEKLGSALPLFGDPETFLRQTQTLNSARVESPELQQDIRDHLRRIEQNQRSRVTTRPE